uniref:Uncharacterized protein n=1 Tax=Picea sitchensis TaxID=3332 RepID=B8LLH1_PICSI|nr:unknown [Picea sitchensis]
MHLQRVKLSRILAKASMAVLCAHFNHFFANILNLWLFVSKLQLILHCNLEIAFPASMAVFSAHCSSANCIHCAAQWKSGHSLSSFYSSLRHCNHFLATMATIEFPGTFTFSMTLDF